MKVYLDNASTVAMSRAAINEYLVVAREFFANPQGSHSYSRSSLSKLDEYRERCARVLGCSVGAVFFTSGATEADNIAIYGCGEPNSTVACSTVEHKAVIAPVEARSRKLIAVDVDGQIDRDLFRDFLKSNAHDLSLVSLMAVNNETGVSFDIEILAGMVHKHAPASMFHCDAVQLANTSSLKVVVDAADLVSLSAHKFGGPKGTGILVCKDRTMMRPLALGGSQEKDLRPGTHDLASIGAMTVALEETQANVVDTWNHLWGLQQRFESQLMQILPDVIISGLQSRRSPSISHLLIPGTRSEELLFVLDELGVAASGGAACASGALDPSHVVLAMGVEPKLAKGALRFSFATTNTNEDIDYAAKALLEACSRLERPLGAR